MRPGDHRGTPGDKPPGPTTLLFADLAPVFLPTMHKNDHAFPAFLRRSHLGREEIRMGRQGRHTRPTGSGLTARQQGDTENGDFPSSAFDPPRLASAHLVRTRTKSWNPRRSKILQSFDQPFRTGIESVIVGQRDGIDSMPGEERKALRRKSEIVAWLHLGLTQGRNALKIDEEEIGIASLESVDRDEVIP